MNGIHEVTGSIPVWSTTFHPVLDELQVLESGGGYGGAIEPFSIKRDATPSGKNSCWDLCR